MPAAIYTRVSTEDQAKHGYSLESQLEACRTYAANHGLTVRAEFTDDMSGAKLNRPGLDELRDSAEAGDLTDVIVYSMDRLSRSLAHSLILRDEWLAKGITMHTVEQGAAESTAEGRLSENMHAVIAEYEREKIHERTRRGMIQKAKRGKMVLSGHVPYGYKKHGRGREAELQRDEEELTIVKKMFEMYVYGDDGTGLSLYEVSYRMNQLGTPSPGGLEWTYGMIARLLEYELYSGVYYYGKTRTVNEKRVKRPEGEWIKIDVPELACISDELFQAARARKIKNKERAKRNRKREYLLANHFRCEACGRAMVGRYHKGTVTHHYRCSANWRKGNNPRCPQQSRSVSVRKADTAVWEWVERIITDEQHLRAGLESMAAKREGKEEVFQEQLRAIEVSLEKTEKRILRLIDQMSDCEEAVLQQKAVSDDLISQISAQMEAVRGLLPSLSFEKKRTILDLLNVRVIFRGNDTDRLLEVYCDLPGLEADIDLRLPAGTYADYFVEYS